MEKPKARFELFKDSLGEFRWHFVHIGTGNIMADSGEGYKNKTDAKYGIRFLKDNALDAPVEDLT
jgi:uncharacterized protein YegP (UPF0339 family)